MNMTRTVERYVGFNPSSSEGEEWWTAKTLNDLVWNLRHIHQVSGTLWKAERPGQWNFGDMEIYDTKKHPKVIEVLE